MLTTHLRGLRSGIGAVVLVAAGLVNPSVTLEARQAASLPVAIDADDIGGVVTNAGRPEPGVWVIAETHDFETRFIRIVVTDDDGRYVVPDLPTTRYNLLVRGYGLVDSPRVTATPGQHLDLQAVSAPDAATASRIYPANYWLSLMAVPPGDLADAQVASTVKNCLQCHQIGDLSTREFPAVLGTFATSLDAWDARVAVGPSGPGMATTFQRLGPQRAAFSTWSDRIAAGAFPLVPPPRPAGRERNLVITLRDWGTPTAFSHTHAATDRRDPTVNPYGRIYGPNRTDDTILWLDPIRNDTGEVAIPTRDVDLPRPRSVASPYWGAENIAGGPAAPRSGVMDEQGRVYVASTIRAAENQPDWCREGSDNPYARYFPLRTSSKHVAMYNPRSDDMTLIDTCFRADHNDFGPGDDNPLYFGQRDVIGWISMKTFDDTQDEQVAQGWCPGVLDTNGDGTITKPWTEPDQTVDAALDHRISFAGYSLSASPVDGSVWVSGIGDDQTTLVRLERGSRPPDTCKAEVYSPPTNTYPPITGGAGGVELDSEGVAWQNWRASDHITRFDRRKCRTLNGPTATGAHCPEGWTVYRKDDLPTLEGTPYHADLNYLIMTDRHDTAGLGRDTVITYPNNSDALLALLPQTGEWVTMRVPYPLGFYTRQAHGRIDDPAAGWKGRGLWSAVMTYAVWHLEGEPGVMGGKGEKPFVATFQFRTDPLAK